MDRERVLELVRSYWFEEAEEEQGEEEVEEEEKSRKDEEYLEVSVYEEDEVDPWELLMYNRDWVVMENGEKKGDVIFT